jgi:asparagine synthase (glutamine-hydrolysing)
MCGIAGKVNFDGKGVDPALVRRMLDTIVHRGPDDQGIHCASNVGLGERRLSVIDLSHQAVPPLANEDGTIWIVFNGEIYNFAELRETLIDKGHAFRTRSDTEVILHLYEECDTACLQHLRGMFAFVVWDQRRKLIFAARDRMGKKPLYYHHAGSSLTFGSEIKAITADPAVRRTPNYRAIDAYLTHQYVPSPDTAFEGIDKLPPAHYLLCDADGNIQLCRYWSSPTERRDDISIEEAEHELEALLRESIRLRMVADVPLGALLSGGIDSGTTVALMAQQSSRPIRTFSIGFEEADYNELPYARQVAERYATEHHEFIVKPELADVLPLLVRHYNEPFADSSALPTYYLSKLTRQHVTVALSGDGGDENFGGYQRYAELARYGVLDRVPGRIDAVAWWPLEGALRRASGLGTLARVERAAHLMRTQWPERYRTYMAILKDQEKRALYAPEFSALVAEESIDDAWSEPWLAGDNAYEWMMRHDRGHYLPDCLMVKTDVASMANSLEVRCPLLDHLVVEYAATLPTDFKIHGTKGKVILRRIARRLLPQSVVDKKKTGFAPPLARWLRTGLAEMLRATLLDQRALRRGMFRPQAIKALVGEHVTGKRDWSNRLWALMMLELWFREFID